jgi:hypothetical protein
VNDEERRRVRYQEAVRAVVLAFMTVLLVALMVGVVALADLVL